MNIHIGSRTRTTVAVWTASLAVGALLTLSGCASGAVPTVHPAEADKASVHYSRVAPVPEELRGSTPDQIDRALAQLAAEQKALRVRFAGVPADRIEEQLAKETRG